MTKPFATIIFILIIKISTSQHIAIPVNDTIVEYPVIIKTKGDSLKYFELAYYKNDTSKLAWKKLINNDKIIGVYKVYYPNGKLYKKVVYDLSGKKNGIYQEWDSNGNLIVYGQYKNGLKNGTWQYHKEKRFEVYKKGLKHGRWRIYEGKVPWTLYVYKKDSLIKVKAKK